HYTSCLCYSNVHGRGLHSFPTRRSSDLVAKSGASEVKLEMEDIKITIRTGAAGSFQEPTYVQHLPMANPAQQQVHQQVAAQDPGDRKSTRLNSSHVKISYAVFCLKKKKN